MSKLEEKCIKKRGYFGIAVYNPKFDVNVGTLWRTAQSLGADFICTIGKRYTHQRGDTCKATKHIPIWHFETFKEFKKHTPRNCKLTAIEIDKKSKVLKKHKHSEREIYLLGAEDYGIPQEILKGCNNVIELSGDFCLNVAVAGSIVLYDRVGL